MQKGIDRAPALWGYVVQYLTLTELQALLTVQFTHNAYVVNSTDGCNTWLRLRGCCYSLPGTYYKYCSYISVAVLYFHACVSGLQQAPPDTRNAVLDKPKTD